MRLPLVVAVVLVVSGVAPAASALDDPAAFVDPFVGTAPGGTDFGHGGGAGNTFPGAAAPLGGVQWSPDTVTYQHGGYAYGDHRIRGFSLKHLSGAGCAAYGDIPFLPSLGTGPAAYGTFSHADEQAAPGSYRVTFDDGITTELAATRRSGIARFTYPLDDTRPAALSVDAGRAFNAATGAVDIGRRTLSGYSDSGRFCKKRNRYRLYFHAEFDRPFARAVHPDGRPGAALLSFAPEVREVTVRVGISFVDVEGARRNAWTEQRTLPFDTVRTTARARWNDWLSRIAVTGGTRTQRRVFYTALYHSLLHPSVFSDTDGRYTGMDGDVHRTRPGHDQYADFSGWDVYRGQVQLLALIAPREASDIAQSIVEQGLQAGYFDRWTLANGGTGVMVGDPLPTIAAAVHAFGATDFDARALLRAALAGRRDDRQRPGHERYDTLGYIPTGTRGVWGSVSTTLEYAVADHALARLAQRLGDQDAYDTLLRASGSWRNLVNPATGTLQPRAADGTWPPYDPAQTAEYVEGNGAQYAWLVPHDLPGLFATMGGTDAATARLDTFFTELNAGPHRPYAYLGNEPSFGTPWAYAYAARPDRVRDTVHRALTTLFTDDPAGLVGNDDLGALSAWAVWASIGRYPDVPGTAHLVRTTPVFTSVTVHRR